MKLNIKLMNSNICNILNNNCHDLLQAFSYATNTLLLTENNKIVSCLGFSKSNNNINIDGTCTATTSRNKKYNSILRIILFMIAKKQHIKYITSSANRKSMPIMINTLNAKCSENLYLEECDYECNCLVDIEDYNTQHFINDKIMKYLKYSHLQPLLLDLIVKDWNIPITSSHSKSRSKSRSRSNSKGRSRRSHTRSHTRSLYRKKNIIKSI